MSENTRRLTTLAMLTAISVLLVFLIRIPWPALPFLEYDPADIPILIGTLMFGPLWGFALTFVVSLLQALTVSAGTGSWQGFIMHTCATGVLSIVVGVIYRKLRFGKPIARCAVALAAGALSMVLMMIPLNLIVTPAFTGQPVAAVRDMLLPIIIPFNATKAGVNAAVAFLLYLGLRAVPSLKDRL